MQHEFHDLWYKFWYEESLSRHAIMFGELNNSSDCPSDDVLACVLRICHRGLDIIYITANMHSEQNYSRLGLSALLNKRILALSHDTRP